MNSSLARFAVFGSSFLLGLAAPRFARGGASARSGLSQKRHDALRSYVEKSRKTILRNLSDLSSQAGCANVEKSRHTMTKFQARSSERSFEVKLMRKSPLAVVGHIGPAPRGDKMSAPHALAALAALGQPTRLADLPAADAARAGRPCRPAPSRKRSAVRTTRFQAISAFSPAPAWSAARATAAPSSIAPMSRECARWSLSWSPIAATATRRFAILQDALRETACCAPAPKSKQRRK